MTASYDVVSALKALGGAATATDLCAKLACPLCGGGTPEADAQLAMQRATDKGVIVVNPDWTLSLPGASDDQ